jgi:hypothetical protein
MMRSEQLNRVSTCAVPLDLREIACSLIVKLFHMGLLRSTPLHPLISRSSIKPEVCQYSTMHLSCCLVSGYRYEIGIPSARVDFQLSLSRCHSSCSAHDIPYCWPQAVNGGGELHARNADSTIHRPPLIATSGQSATLCVSRINNEYCYRLWNIVLRCSDRKSNKDARYTKTG